jgi:hypothetical protein
MISFITNVQATLNLNDENLGERFGLSGADLKDVREGRSTLKAINLIMGTDSFNVSIDAILEDQVDFLFLGKQFLNGDQFLPEKYSIGAFGKKRSVTNILDYIEKKHGLVEKALLLRKFQLCLNHFDNNDEMINNSFIVDLMNEISKRGYSRQDIIEMGENSYICNKDNLLGMSLKKRKTSKELLEYIFQEAIVHFDKNYHYKIHQLTEDFCEVRLFQNQDVLDALKIPKMGSPLVSLMKQGVINSFPRYIGNVDFKTTIVKSIYNNDEYCSYQINYSEKCHSKLKLVH